MADRSAPESGYVGGNKRHYRRIVWNTFAETCPVPRAEAKALLMPSLEGDEIDIALSKGFRERNIYIVDRNPAIVAVLKRRYPLVTAIGLPLSRIRERIPPNTIHVANFDLCGCVSDTLSRTLNRAAKILADESIVAVTTLRGREPDLTAIKELVAAHDVVYSTDNKSDGDVARIISVEAALTYGDRFYHTPLRHHIYKSVSNHSTMLVCISWLVETRIMTPPTEQEFHDDLLTSRARCEYVVRRFSYMKKLIDHWSPNLVYGKNQLRFNRPHA